MLKEWGSEFSPQKLGALGQPQKESSRQLSIVGAGATVLCPGQSGSQQNRTKSRILRKSGMLTAHPAWVRGMEGVLG